MKQIFLMIALLVLATIGSMAQTKVQIDYDLKIARQAGLTAWVSTTPGFDGVYTSFRNHARSNMEAADSIQPVIIFLRNDSGRTLGYISLVTTYLFKDGTTHRGTTVISRNPITGGMIKPGETYALYPIATYFGNGFSVADLRMVNNFHLLLGNCASVKMSIDAITFEDDGSLVGPDTAGLRVRINAERSAADEVQRGVAALHKQGHDATSYLDSFISSPLLPIDPENMLQNAEYWARETRRKMAMHLKSGQ